MRALASGLAVVLAGLLLAAQQPAGMCELTLTLRDAETQRPLPGLVRITDATGKIVPLEGLLARQSKVDVDTTRGNWSVIIEKAVVSVPRGKLTIEAFSGLETELQRVEVNLGGKAKAEANLTLKRFYDAGAKRFRSGNTHLHLMKLSREESDRYLREIPRADGLDLLFVSYLERAEADREYITNRYSRAEVESVGKTSGVTMGWGEEHRHNFTAQGQGFGHVMLLDIQKLVQPVSIGPGITKEGSDGLPVQRGIDTARRDGGTTVWCHNNWGMERLPNWFTGRLHAQNIFDGGTHGSYKDSFYRCLNAGLKVPFSTGTDWFIYDFSRVYVPVAGAGTTSVKEWLKGLSEGRSYITNGPLLEFQIEGRGIGETVKLPGNQPVKIAAKAVGRVDFGRLELVLNGRAVRTEKSRAEGGHFVAEMKFSHEIAEPCWLAVRVPPPPVKDDPELQEAVPQNELGQPLFAHSSPVYLEMAGRSVFDRPTADSLLTEIERNLEQITKDALFADAVERARVMDVYAEGMDALKRHIEKHQRGTGNN